MTHRRDPESWTGVWHGLIRALGRPRLAAALGVSEGRLDQMASPLRQDFAVLDRAVAADIAAAGAGLGCPIYEAYRRRLIQAGCAPACEGRSARLEAAIRAAAQGLRATVAGLESALQPALRPQEAGRAA